jgi:RNA polymerase sigma-70 factor (ECF subfamily)
MSAPVTKRPDPPGSPPHAFPDGPDVLRQLYLSHAEEVMRVAYRITCSRSDAEDVLQDVFVGLPEALRSFTGRGSIAGWLRRVAARMALMRLRASRRRREVWLEAEHPGVASGAYSDRVIDRAALLHALEELPDPLRVVFTLKEVEGYSHAEIAELLGIRSGTSEVRLHRAKARLRQLLRSAR